MRHPGGLVALVLAALGAPVVRACSGPGAERTIQLSEWAGWGLWGLATVLVVAANLRARRLGGSGRSVAAGWVLVFAHPGLWMSARGGDCGMQLVQSSLLFTILAAGIGIWGMLRVVEPDQDDSDRSPRP